VQKGKIGRNNRSRFSKERGGWRLTWKVVSYDRYLFIILYILIMIVKSKISYYIIKMTVFFKSGITKYNKIIKMISS
jgi:hypothetical protein